MTAVMRRGRPPAFRGAVVLPKHRRFARTDLMVRVLQVAGASHLGARQRLTGYHISDEAMR